MGNKNIDNANESATPRMTDSVRVTNSTCWVKAEAKGGLTKREHFAGLALQGLISGGVHLHIERDEFAQQAVRLADELLEELEVNYCGENEEVVNNDNI